MRIVFIMSFMLMTIVTSFSQREQRVKAMQIAFITEEIALTSDQAERFWPIYNKGSQDQDAIRAAIKNLDANTEEMSASEAAENIDTYLRLENDLLQSRIDMMQDLRNVISDQQVIRLIKAKEKFKKEVLRQIKSKRKKRRKGR